MLIKINNEIILSKLFFYVENREGVRFYGFKKQAQGKKIGEMYSAEFLRTAVVSNVTSPE